MTAAAEALGLTLPGASSVPAAYAGHARMAAAVGRRIVEMVWTDLRPQLVLTATAFTNAVTAMAGRAGVELPLRHFDEVGRRTPVLANIRPSGEHLMADFHHAGGLRALIVQLGELLDLHVSEDELAERRAAWHPPAAPPVRGYGALFAQHVTQADKGCDFDFLTGAGGPEPAIH
jgi:dihydroxyacid dehydratase/phosphogluconate dehydratase